MIDCARIDKAVDECGWASIHIAVGGSDRYADVGGYMSMGAQVHLGILRQRKE